MPPSKESRRPVAVDLFAGAGGMTLGFEQAGFDVLASVEYDPVHAAAHAFNFPLAETVCASVADVSSASLLAAARRGLERHGRDVKRWNGRIDVVFGGPPCQGFSSIGRRLIDDHRNQLVFHFYRLIAELRPRYFVMENVPGMAKGGHASILAQLVGEFEKTGYRFPEGIYKVLNAADFGVPQERKRLILIGSDNDEALAHYPDASVNPVPKRAAKARRNDAIEGLPTGPSVMDAIGDLPDLDQFPALLKSDSARLPADAQARQDELMSDYAASLRDSGLDASDLTYPRSWDRALLTGSARTVHGATSIARFSSTPVGETEPVSRFYRLDPAGLSNTLRAGTGSEGGAFTSPRPIHPTLPRVISVREAARLHSFPDWFRFHETKWNGFRQIGNAVAPAVGRAVAGRVACALGSTPEKPARRLKLADPALLAMTMQVAASHFRADPASVPKGRRKDYSSVAAFLFRTAEFDASGNCVFGDADVREAFRSLKIRPPVDIKSVAVQLTKAVPANGDGPKWIVSSLPDGRYSMHCIHGSRQDALPFADVVA